MKKNSKPSYSAAKARILEAAIDLFSEFGVAGTSLQMIADRIGVTKAAVYHQFPAKEDIVIAVGRLVFDSLEALITQAETQPTVARQRQAFLDATVHLAVASRRFASFLHQDPVMLRLFEEHKPFKQTFKRMDKLLMGASDTLHQRVTVAALITALGGSVRHPLVTRIDDDSLKKELDKIVRLFLKQLD